MGGLAGLRLAQDHPDRVASLTSIEGNLAPEDCFWSRQVYERPELDPDVFVAAFVDRTLSEGGVCSGLAALGVRNNVRPAAVRPYFASIVDESDTGNLLDTFIELPIPRMFMYGSENHGLSYLGRLRQAGIRLAEIPHCGHFPMYSNPPAMWKQLGSFIANAERHIR